MAPGYKNIYAKRDRAEEKKKALKERELISQEREIKRKQQLKKKTLRRKNKSGFRFKNEVIDETYNTSNS